MARCPAITLPYPSSSVRYPNVLRAPRSIQFLFPLVGSLMLVGFAFVLAPGNGTVPGCIAIGLSGITLLYFTLLYTPLATSLCISKTGITYTVVFWRRKFPWERVREMRVICADGPICRDFLVEVVMQGTGTKQLVRPTIPARLLGWPPEVLVEEMYDWRSRRDHP
jgi:hypothetical protein